MGFLDCRQHSGFFISRIRGVTRAPRTLAQEFPAWHFFHGGLVTRGVNETSGINKIPRTVYPRQLPCASDFYERRR